MTSFGVCLLISALILAAARAAPVTTEAIGVVNVTGASFDQVHLPWGNVKIDLPDFSKIAAAAGNGTGSAGCTKSADGKQMNAANGVVNISGVNVECKQ